MNFSDIDILNLIPQRPPFVMVDELLHYDPILSNTRFLIKESNILVENGFLSESGITENMAQSCAARIGYVNKVINQSEVKIGFIGGVKNLVIHRLPLVGNFIYTDIEVVGEVMSMILVKAVVKELDDIIAECEMKIAIVE